MEAVNLSRTRISISPIAANIYEARKIGIALGPGLPYGLVDLGMLIALKQLKISVSMICGTSMGAVIGSLYASGIPLEEIRQKIIELFAKGRIKELLKKDMKIPGVAFSTAEKLFDEILHFAGCDLDFHELMVPLYVVAADKASQKSVILRHGRVFDAVRASMAIPIMLKKHKIANMKLSDGAILKPLNTRVLYEEGADFVIAIQAKPIRSAHKRVSPFTVKLIPFVLKGLGWQVNRDIFFSKPDCEILLRPRVPRNLAKDFSRVNEIIKIGIKITYDAFHEIRNKKFAQSESHLLSKVDLKKENFDKKLSLDISLIESYLLDMEKKTEAMANAELLNEFPKFAKAFQTFLDRLTLYIAKEDINAEALKKKFKNLIGLIEESPFTSRVLAKPLGYSGDYQMLNCIYNDDLFKANSNMGKLLNYFIFSSQSSNAIRNRAKIIQGLIQQKLSFASELKVTGIACGPAREVSDLLNILAKEKTDKKIIWTLIDNDFEALEYAKQIIPRQDKILAHFIQAGIAEIIKEKIILKQQDIIYSLGLFDYLEDKIAKRLLKNLYNKLKIGGLLLTGNFSSNHPLQVLMEVFGNWKLIYRKEEELLAIAKNSMPDGRHFIMAEPEGINLILVSSKPR